MDQQEKIYDLIGIGIGPFNLSLAALLDEIDGVEPLFFEQKEGFDWHPGMLIEGTKMQVPFIADLVTMADPTNPYSFLNYISKNERMYQFYFLQRLDIPRREYNDYCQWVAKQLDSCQFGQRVTNIRHYKDNKELFEVEVTHMNSGEVEVYCTKHLVMGTGSVPVMPQSFRNASSEDVFHTADFLSNRDRCRKADSITVVGSGQSAAEAFRELLREQRDCGYQLDWITRSAGFESMEESKLSLEHFSPDYVNYFYQLPQHQKDEIFASQGLYYKGISNHTINDIYNLLYEYSVGREELNIGLQVLSEVKEIRPKVEGGYELECYHYQKGETFTHHSDLVIAATGYKPYVPDFVHHLEDFLEWDEKGRYKVTKDYRLVKTKETANEIYVHSGISHTHGVGSTNLGLSIHRNKVIINHLTGREVFPINEKNIFQSFNV
ncbi:lysine N(6)-hydroxylase/L-ornithine N(5)-oxygenase family protein [Halobacillus karajensis]|uniref:L-lysine N6-monooxygenase MbtG n=1 Tax=Halobacillus karajensis TaxID=195088 RepID=A0A059NVF5_9BACI|nr:SidA/IucD/PvdA family monooxygenase [Halobacillus karajensis]CDQ18634.1 L-lysine N6-monooxygenase [Halobacillus karajensis]CDQ23294.1 L-lysine N6-monooxygenase [Halobacillus karajensis]CDQ26776.1 L-lysine N6-monooxygenase [Halobacillus karajensis]